MALADGLVMQRHEADDGGWVSSPLLRETKGAVLVEYVTALALAISLATALLVVLGRVQMPGYGQRRAALSQAYP